MGLRAVIGYIVDRLEINPNKHAATIKTITLNTFKTEYFNSAACRSSFMSDWAARTIAQLTHIM